MEPHPHSHHDSSSENTLQLDNAATATSARRKALNRIGQYWLCAGIGMMATSFGINLFLHGDGTAFVTTSMYVLTTLGTLCVVKALANFFN